MPVPDRKRTPQNDTKHTVLKAVITGKTRFNDIWLEVGGSRTSLKLCLDALEKEGLINRLEVSHKNVQYTLKKGTFNHPLLQTLIFENGAYLRIAVELVKERQAYVSKERVMYQDKERSEGFAYLDLDPQFIAQKSEGELVQAIDKWLTPIVLYAIIRELKTGYEWTKTLHGVTQKLMELIKHTDLNKFEEALRANYSDRLVQKYFFLPSQEIPIIDSFDDIIEYVKVQKQTDLDYKQEMRRKGLKP